MGVGFKCPVCRNSFDMGECGNCGRSKWSALYAAVGENKIVVGARCKFCDEKVFAPINCPNCNRRIHEKFWYKTGCFIATAVYNDYEHPVVKDLRIFRDKWLAQRSWGSRFIAFYYKNGPHLARIIEKNKFLKYLCKNCLIRPLHYITKSIDHHSFKFKNEVKF
jgi:hypothetical protein